MATCPVCAGASAGKRIAFKGFEVFDLCIKCASYSVCLISPNVEVKVKENAIRWADIAIENNREKIYLANCIRSWKQSAEEFVALHAPIPVQTFKEEPKEVMDIDSTEINLDATIKGFSTGNYSAVMYQENKRTIDSSVLDVKKENFFAEPSPAQESAPFSAPAVEEEPVVPFSAPAVEEEPVGEKEEATAEGELFAFTPDTADGEGLFEEEAEAAEEESIAEEETPAIEEKAPYGNENVGADCLFAEESSLMTDEETDAAVELYGQAKENFTDDEPDILDYLREIALSLKSINAKMERIERDIEELKNR